MMKLALRALGLTVVLQAASLAFAGEMIVTLLILVTIALSAAAIVLGGNSGEETPELRSPPFEAVERPAARSGVEGRL